jgi:hypothetical protein
MKRGVYGNFHSVSEAHLHRYLFEFDFKYNHRSALGYDDLRAPIPCYAVPRARGYSINGVTKPRMLEQKARAFMRLRKRFRRILTRKK